MPPPPPDEAPGVLMDIWNRSANNYPLRSKLIEEDFQIRIPSEDLERMNFDEVLIHVAIEVYHMPRVFEQKSGKPSPTTPPPRKQTKVTQEENERARRILDY